MGQHKTNPTAIAAKKGELPPKPKRMSKREEDRLFTAKVVELICNMPATRALINARQRSDFDE